MATKSPKSQLRRETQRQMALIHGDMSSDVQSALRHLRETMEMIPEEEWKRREDRWRDVEEYVDSHQLAKYRDAHLN